MIIILCSTRLFGRVLKDLSTFIYCVTFAIGSRLVLTAYCRFIPFRVSFVTAAGLGTARQRKSLIRNGEQSDDAHHHAPSNVKSVCGKRSAISDNNRLHTPIGASSGITGSFKKRHLSLYQS